MIEKHNFFLLTGGPGVGKTTLIDHLRAERHACVEESHRRVIRDEVASGGSAVPWLDRAAYQARVAREDIAIFESMANETGLVFFDRGILDSAADRDPPDWLVEAGRTYRYNRRAFVFPPWREIYRQDAERKQTWEECEIVHGRILEGLAAFDYDPVIVPPGPVETRAAFVLDQVSTNARSST